MFCLSSHFILSKLTSRHSARRCTKWLRSKRPLHFNRCPKQLPYYYTITMSVPKIFYSLKSYVLFKRYVRQILVLKP